MMSMKLTRIDQMEVPKEDCVYDLLDGRELETLVLHHSDFQVDGQINIDMYISEQVDKGYPVWVTREKPDETLYDMLVGHLDQFEYNEPQPE